IRLAADAVHGDGKRGVRFARDRAERHGAGGEALDDVLRRLDLIDRYRGTALVRRRLDAEQAADGEQVLRLLVDDAGVLLILLVGIAAHGVLQRRDRRRVPDVILAAHAHRIVAADVKHGAVDRRVAEGVAVPAY